MHVTFRYEVVEAEVRDHDFNILPFNLFLSDVQTIQKDVFDKVNYYRQIHIRDPIGRNQHVNVLF